MSISAISSAIAVVSKTPTDKRDWEIENHPKKTQSIWARIYYAIIGVFSKIIQIARSSIGAVVRDAFFFPLRCPLIANRQQARKQLQIEDAYNRDFWDPKKPLDPNFKEQSKIREKFAPPEDRTLNIQLKDGKTVQITCRILQTKAKGVNCYNFVQLPGIYASISNTIGTIYPYLAAYLNSEKEGIAYLLLDLS